MIYIIWRITMIVFIVPLRSAQTVNSWEFVSKLFERCIKSVCQQTSPQFKVVVVCHERPLTIFEHPSITYIEVDFPIPIWDDNSDIYSRDKDRARKVWVGLNHAHQYQPSYVMIVDADDLVDKRIAEFVLQHPQSNGWYIEKGYEYCEGSDYIYLMRKNFYDKCGTCYIIRYELLNKYKNFQFEDVKGFQFLHHQFVPDLMLENGTPLAKLPFAGAVYVIDHGENVWLTFRKDLMQKSPVSWKEIWRFRVNQTVKFALSQRLTPALRERFGIYAL